MDDPTNWQRDNTPIHFFNPLKSNIEVPIRDDDNQPKIITLLASELATHPRWLADILKKHLVDAIINDRKLGYATPEQRQLINQEIEGDING